MKKALFLSMAVLALGFMSCKKCQTCNTKTVQDYGSYSQQVNTSDEYCGDDYDNAPSPGTTTQSSGGVTQTVTITCEDS
ncbi:MAG: hypothetical protein HUJ25_10025 [Crocinitomicaceae bacterium]|nr:hypothetical protein [Crocinitomicaceae bacterium]